MRGKSVTPEPAAGVRALPVAVLVGLGVAVAWHERGSIAAADWLGYAIVAGLALAAIAASGASALPSRPLALGVLGLVGLAGWDALSLRWSATPALARDEALLALLYAIALLVPALCLRGTADRLVGLGIVAAA